MRLALGTIAAVLAVAAGVTSARQSKEARPEFLVPNEETIWYVGNGVNEAPVVLDNAAGVPLDASQYYKLTFIEKGKVRYAKMSVGADELNAGRLAFDFGSSTPIDDDRCSVKLERVKLMYDPDVTDSPRFRVFRIGAQPRVPARYRYVADILKPAYNQEYSADEPLPLEIQIAMDIPEGQKLEVVLKDAVTGEEIEREIDEDGDGEADDEEPVAKSFAGSDVDEALRVLTSTMNIRGAVTAGRRYFVEVNAMTGMFQKRQTMLYRSAPFTITGASGATGLPTSSESESSTAETIRSHSLNDESFEDEEEL